MIIIYQSCDIFRRIRQKSSYRYVNTKGNKIEDKKNLKLKIKRTLSSINKLEKEHKGARAQVDHIKDTLCR